MESTTQNGLEPQDSDALKGMLIIFGICFMVCVIVTLAIIFICWYRRKMWTIRRRRSYFQLQSPTLRRLRRLNVTQPASPSSSPSSSHRSLEMYDHSTYDFNTELDSRGGSRKTDDPSKLKGTKGKKLAAQSRDASASSQTTSQSGIFSADSSNTSGLDKTWAKPSTAARAASSSSKGVIDALKDKAHLVYQRESRSTRSILSDEEPLLSPPQKTLGFDETKAISLSPDQDALGRGCSTERQREEVPLINLGGSDGHPRETHSDSRETAGQSSKDKRASGSRFIVERVPESFGDAVTSADTHTMNPIGQASEHISGSTSSGVTEDYVTTSLATPGHSGTFTELAPSVESVQGVRNYSSGDVTEGNLTAPLASSDEYIATQSSPNSVENNTTSEQA